MEGEGDADSGRLSVVVDMLNGVEGGGAGRGGGEQPELEIQVREIRSGLP